MGQERYQHYEMIAKAEAETTPAEIIWIGRLDGGLPDHKVWSGGITAETEALKDRFQTDEAGVQRRIEELKQSIESYYVPTSPNAQVRCIDGRSETEETVADLPELGPQLAGGTPATALSYRLAHFESMPEGATIETDLDEISRIITSLGLPYLPGAHDDEHNGVGCGALAHMLRIAGKMEDRVAMQDYVRAITDDYYDQEIFEEVLGNVSKILGPNYKDTYFMKDETTGEYTFAPRLLDKTEQIGRSEDRKAVEVLRGNHNELLLMINKQPGTTLNRDKLSADNNHLAQVFNYDYWVTVDRAQQFFPGDQEAQKKIITSKVMFAVGTAMALTDGSLEAGIRQTAP